MQSFQGFLRWRRRARLLLISPCRSRCAGAPRFLTVEAATTAERHADALFGDLEAMTAEARSLLGSARSVEEAHTRMALAVKAKQVC